MKTGRLVGVAIGSVAGAATTGVETTIGSTIGGAITTGATTGLGSTTGGSSTTGGETDAGVSPLLASPTIASTAPTAAVSSSPTSIC